MIDFSPIFATPLTRVQPNILVDDTGHARITDFGLAAVTQNLDSIRCLSEDHGDTARWTAPEILSEEGTYSKEADIFSFAMVMIEVCCELVTLAESLLTATPYHRRYIPAWFRSAIAYLQR